MRLRAARQLAKNSAGGCSKSTSKVKSRNPSSTCTVRKAAAGDLVIKPTSVSTSIIN